jgi:hypothetical protein
VNGNIGRWTACFLCVNVCRLCAWMCHATWTCLVTPEFYFEDYSILTFSGY